MGMDMNPEKALDRSSKNNEYIIFFNVFLRKRISKISRIDFISLKGNRVYTLFLFPTFSPRKCERVKQ